MATTDTKPLDFDIFTQECLCGSSLWTIQVAWDDDQEIGTYSKEMYCADCGAKAITPPFDPRFEDQHNGSVHY